MFEWNLWFLGLTGTYLTTTTACLLSLKFMSYEGDILEFITIVVSLIILIIHYILPFFILFVAWSYLTK